MRDTGFEGSTCIHFAPKEETAWFLGRQSNTSVKPDIDHGQKFNGRCPLSIDLGATLRASRAFQQKWVSCVSRLVGAKIRGEAVLTNPKHGTGITIHDTNPELGLLMYFKPHRWKVRVSNEARNCKHSCQPSAARQREDATGIHRTAVHTSPELSTRCDGMWRTGRPA